MLSTKTEFLALVIVALFSSVRVASGCILDSDCFLNNVCCGGSCQSQNTECLCSFDSECPGDLFCYDGVCSIPPTEGYVPDPWASELGTAGIIIGVVIAKLVCWFLLGRYLGCGPLRCLFYRARRNNAARAMRPTAEVVVVANTATNPLYRQQPPPMGQPGQYPPQQQPGNYHGPAQYNQAPGSGPMPAFEPLPPYPGREQNQEVVTDNPQTGHQHNPQTQFSQAPGGPMAANQSLPPYPGQEQSQQVVTDNSQKGHQHEPPVEMGSNVI